MQDLENSTQHRNKQKYTWRNKQFEATYKVVGIISICFSIGLGLVIQNIKFIRQENHIRELVIKKRNLDIEITPYIVQENRLVQLNKIEKYARNVLKMNFPREEKIKKIIVELKE